jgi:putative ABC transport system permease protein
MNGRVDKEEKISAFQNEIMQIPGVLDLSLSSSIPGISINRQSENIKRLNSVGPIASAFKIVSANEGFLPSYGIELVAGRNFLEQANWQSTETIISETAVKELGFKNPESAIGEFIDVQNQSLKIAGVIKDYHHLSLKEKIAPLILVQNLYWDYSVGYYSIQFDARRTKEILREISEVWNKRYPGEVASFRFTDDQFASQYQAEHSFNKILSLGSFIALLISCIGLFVLASFDARKRIKEIGIRKINGATVSEIMRLINIDLVKWVAIAFVIAAPIAWYAIYQWLGGFAYKTELSWWIFVLAGILVLGISLLTVSWQSWKAATRNPVEALRYE